jgi:hypothetical protein
MQAIIGGIDGPGSVRCNAQIHAAQSNSVGSAGLEQARGDVGGAIDQRDPAASLHRRTRSC